MTKPKEWKPTEKMERAVHALSMGSTHRQAADYAEVSESAIEQYKKNPRFMALLEAKKTSIVTSVSAQLNTKALRAIAVLTEMMETSNLASVKVSAARALLSEARAWADAQVMERLLDVEKQIRASQEPTALALVPPPEKYRTRQAP